MGDQNRAWNFPIQWSRAFGEEIRFRTEIITSRRGNEQRIAQRDKPRIGYDFESFLDFKDFREALLRLSENQGTPIHFPHPQFATTTTTAASGGSAIGLASTPGWIVAGSKLFLEQDGKREMFTVGTVGFNSVTPDDDLDQVFTTGAIVRRGVSGYVNGESELRAATSRVGLSRVEVDADPVTTWHPNYSTVPQSLNGKEYFVLGPQWGSDITVKFDQPIIELNVQRGDVDRVFPTPYTTRQTKIRFLLRTQDHVDRLVGLFYRCRGRQKSFYMEQQLDEIRPLSIVEGNTFTVPGADFSRRYNGNPMYRFVCIKTATLNLTTNVVQVLINDQGDSVVTVGDIFNDDIPAETIKSIKWVCSCRFESDSLNLEWITDGVAEATVTVRTLEDPA